MSHTVCEKCGTRYRDDHECPEDHAMVLERLRELEFKFASALNRIDVLEDRLNDLTNKDT